jgi:hypothetical protein
MKRRPLSFRFHHQVLFLRCSQLPLLLPLLLVFVTGCAGWTTQDRGNTFFYEANETYKNLYAEAKQMTESPLLSDDGRLTMLKEVNPRINQLRRLLINYETRWIQYQDEGKTITLSSIIAFEQEIRTLLIDIQKLIEGVK